MKRNGTKMRAQTKQESIKKNFIYNALYQGLIIILPLLTAPYVSRVLGASNLGLYSYTQAFANYFFLFAMLGINNYGNRMIAGVRDNQESLNETFWEIYSFQVLTAAIMSVSYIFCCFIFIKTNRLIYVLQFCYVLSSAFDINWACFGLEKFKLTTIRSTIIRINMVAATFLLVNDEKDLWLYTIILSFGNLAAALTIWPFILKHIHFVKVKWSGIRRHIKPNLILFWPVVAVSLYNIMDKLMLGYFSTKDEVGFYTYAESIVQIPNTLILALDNVIMPRMSNLYASNEQGIARPLMNKVMMFAMLMGAAMACGLAGVGRVFTPWFYGKEFERCGLFVVMLCPIIIFKSWAGVLRTQFIIPTHRDKVYIVSLTSGAVINLAINALLIPTLNGVGAIIGTVAAEFSVAFIQFFMVKKDIPIREYLFNGISFCVIGIIMYFPVDALSKTGGGGLMTIGIQIIVGIVLFTSLSCVYMLKIKKDPVLINEGLKLFRIRKRF